LFFVGAQEGFAVFAGLPYRFANVQCKNFLCPGRRFGPAVFSAFVRSFSADGNQKSNRKLLKFFSRSLTAFADYYACSLQQQQDF